MLEQAKGASGNLGADVLADANNAWWTCTAWQERASMHAFVRTEPHVSTMGRLDDWCDEAMFTDWEQDSGDLPDWQRATAAWSPTGRQRVSRTPHRHI